MDEMLADTISPGIAVPGITVYGIPVTTSNTEFKMLADMKANAAAGRTSEVKASASADIVCTTANIDDSSDDQRSDYSWTHCLNLFVHRMQLLGDTRNLLWASA